VTGLRLAADVLAEGYPGSADDMAYAVDALLAGADMIALVRTDAGVEVRGLEPLYGTTGMQVQRSTGLDGSLALRLVDAPVPADTQDSTKENQ